VRRATLFVGGFIDGQRREIDDACFSLIVLCPLIEVPDPPVYHQIYTRRALNGATIMALDGLNDAEVVDMLIAGYRRPNVRVVDGKDME